MSTSELETRAQLMARVSLPTGNTKADREDHIALLLVQMMKDINIVRLANADAITHLKGLEGISSVIGSKACIKDLEEANGKAMNLLEIGCDKILNLTKSKRYTMYIDRKLTALENKHERRTQNKESAMANMRKVTPPKKGSTRAKVRPLQDKVRNIISRRKEDKIQLAPIRQPVRERSNRIHNSHDHTEKILLKNGNEVHLPAPEYDSEQNHYTVRELLIHLLPYDGQGIKRIIEEISKRGRCHCSQSIFMRKFREYKQTKILPDKSEFGDTRGRPVPIATESICDVVEK